MATQTIKTCDGGAPTCEEQVVARISLVVMKDHTINGIFRLDSCDNHVGQQVDNLWESRNELIEKHNAEMQAEYDKLSDKEKQAADRRGKTGGGWIFHGIDVDAAS